MKTKKKITAMLITALCLIPVLVYAAEEKSAANDDFKLMQTTMLNKLGKKLENPKNSPAMVIFFTSKKGCAEKAENKAELKICKVQKP